MAASLLGACTIGAPASPAAVPEGYEYDEAYIRSGDGTTLHADVLRPRGWQEGRRSPVLMTITPYAAHGWNAACQPPCDALVEMAAKVRAFERGYTYVIVDLRGFGGSEGCWDAGGAGEQMDVKAAVEWAASRSWSTGRVGMIGLSYDGWTGIMALATRPRGLAAVVPWAPVVSAYSGALGYMNRVPHWVAAFYAPYYSVAHNNVPPSLYDSPSYFGHWLDHVRPECQGAQAADLGNPDPRASYWRERDLLDRAARSPVPVFAAHGFLDFNVPADQTTTLYPRLRNKGGLWLGQWAHDDPVGWGTTGIGRNAADDVDRFLRRTLLRRAPRRPGSVLVQEAPTLRWRKEVRWPPRDTRTLRIPVRASTYRDEPGNVSGDDVAFTPQATVPMRHGPAGVGSWTFTQPLRREVHLAGNPQLTVRAAGPPRARVVALLYDVSPDGTALLITRGAAELGDGRVDLELYPQDWRIAPRHRLGLLLTGADDSWWIPRMGSGAEVRVASGALVVPALACPRTRFVQGDAGDWWSRVKHPIALGGGIEGGAEVRVSEGGRSRRGGCDGRNRIRHSSPAARRPSSQDP